jgi:F420-dependent oxidoreductase-like protein
MRLNLMIEGQEDVTWEDWVALARACEEHGIDTLFRSDHYLSVQGETSHGSLDAWATVNALAAITDTLRLGTLVSPATFRHPSVLAKLVTSADQISGGRIEPGMGTGWLEEEHRAYGFPFPPMKERMERLEEQLEIVTRSWADGSFDFHGAHYEIKGLDALPKPVQRPRPHLLIGGSGGPRSLRLAARYADEYNTVFKSAEECAQIRSDLDEACKNAGRDPIPLSLMTNALAGLSDDDALEQLNALSDAGVERVMWQHLEHRDLGGVERIARLGRQLG